MTKTPKEKGVKPRLRGGVFCSRGEVLDDESPTSANLVRPIENIMKETIKMVIDSIYDPEFPDTSHFHSRRARHSTLRRIKEEWGASCWFLKFDIRKCFHTIDRRQLISILKEEIDNLKFFYSIHKVFSVKRLIGSEKSP